MAKKSPQKRRKHSAAKAAPAFSLGRELFAGLKDKAAEPFQHGMLLDLAANLGIKGGRDARVRQAFAIWQLTGAAATLVISDFDPWFLDVVCQHAAAFLAENGIEADRDKRPPLTSDKKRIAQWKQFGFQFVSPLVDSVDAIDRAAAELRGNMSDDPDPDRRAAAGRAKRIPPEQVAVAAYRLGREAEKIWSMIADDLQARLNKARAEPFKPHQEKLIRRADDDSKVVRESIDNKLRDKSCKNKTEAVKQTADETGIAVSTIWRLLRRNP